MSIKSKFAATALASLTLGAVIALASTQALANTKGPSGGHGGGTAGHGGHSSHRAPGGHGQQKPQNFYRPGMNSPWKQTCYWLPTIGGGTVTGLESKCYWAKR